MNAEGAVMLPLQTALFLHILMVDGTVVRQMECQLCLR